MVLFLIGFLIKIKPYFCRFIKIVLFLFLTFVFINFYVVFSYKSYIAYNIGQLKKDKVAIILGAGVLSNGDMSSILFDRVVKGLELYKKNKVNKILVSGDHGRENYDEVNTVKKYLLNNGVKPEDIFLDHAGFDTYDSFYRAKNIFNIDSAIVVTQKFHIYRAIYIGNSLGIKTFGYVADRSKYPSETRNLLRENLARIKSFFEVLFGLKSKYLGDKINIDDDGRLTLD